MSNEKNGQTKLNSEVKSSKTVKSNFNFQKTPPSKNNNSSSSSARKMKWTTHGRSNSNSDDEEVILLRGRGNKNYNNTNNNNPNGSLDNGENENERTNNQRNNNESNSNVNKDEYEDSAFMSLQRFLDSNDEEKIDGEGESEGENEDVQNDGNGKEEREGQRKQLRQQQQERTDYNVEADGCDHEYYIHDDGGGGNDGDNDSNYDTRVESSLKSPTIASRNVDHPRRSKFKSSTSTSASLLISPKRHHLNEPMHPTLSARQQQKLSRMVHDYDDISTSSRTPMQNLLQKRKYNQMMMNKRRKQEEKERQRENRITSITATPVFSLGAEDNIFTMPMSMQTTKTTARRSLLYPNHNSTVQKRKRSSFPSTISTSTPR